MTIRKAGADDIPAIMEMASEVFPKTYGDILSKQQLEYMMDMMYSEHSLQQQMTAGKNIFYICEGKGYVSFRYEGRTDEGLSLFHLEKLYVMPLYQGTGLGRKLFETVLEAVKESSSGKARIELNVNRQNRAVSFYEHLGMTISRQGDFPIGRGFFMNDFIMSLDI